MERRTRNERFAPLRLDCAHTSCLLGVDASPVLITELNAPVCSQANGKEEEHRPNASDDQTNREEGQSSAGHDKGSGQKDGRCGCCGGSGVGVGGRVCIRLLGEDTVNEAGFLVGKCGCNIRLRCGVASGKVDLWNKQRLKCIAGELVSIVPCMLQDLAYLVMAGPIRLELILPTYMSVLSSVMVLMVCLCTRVPSLHLARA